MINSLDKLTLAKIIGMICLEEHSVSLGFLWFNVLFLGVA
jgi:hypothetical protein